MVKLNSTRIYRKIEALMGLKVDELLAWFPYGITNNLDRLFTEPPRQVDKEKIKESQRCGAVATADFVWRLS